MSTKHGSFLAVAAFALTLMVLTSVSQARPPSALPRSARHTLGHVLRQRSLLDDEKTSDEIDPDILARLNGNFMTSMAELLNTPFECPVGFGIFRDPVDCTTYYECKHGNYTEHKCEEGLGFDEMKGECVPRENADCPVGPLDEKHKCKTSGLEPYTADCTQYYFCVGTRGFIKSCDSGEKFDTELNMCMPEDHAKCAEAPA